MIEFNLLAVLAIVMVVELVKQAVPPEFRPKYKWIWVTLPLALGASAGGILVAAEPWNVIALTSFVHAAAASYGYKFAREVILKKVAGLFGG